MAVLPSTVSPSQLPTVPQLRAFCAVADHLHFGSAAAELHVSQPAVSAAVAGLEATLKVQLLERAPRGVSLTPVGEAVATQGRRILEELGDLAESASRQGRRHCGPLRLGLIPTIAPYVLPAVLSALRRRLPELEPAVTEDFTDRLLARLANGRLDVAVMALPSGASGLVELPLYSEDFLLAVPPGDPLAGADDLDPAILGRLELLLLAEGHCLRDQTLEVCRDAGIDTRDLASAPAMSLATVSQLVAGGLGATLIPATAVPAESRRERLALARFADPAPGRRVGLVHRAGAARADEYAELAAVLREAVKALPVTVQG
jgi:LysR family transcriptional regulator, hydrogen peroxide-inducible genes activator